MTVVLLTTQLCTSSCNVAVVSPDQLLILLDCTCICIIVTKHSCSHHYLLKDINRSALGCYSVMRMNVNGPHRCTTCRSSHQPCSLSLRLSATALECKMSVLPTPAFRSLQNLGIHFGAHHRAVYHSCTCCSASAHSIYTLHLLQPCSCPPNHRAQLLCRACNVQLQTKQFRA